MLHLFMKKVTRLCKIIAHFRCCQYVTKCLKKSFFNPILDFLEENRILCPHQSVFCSSNSCQSSMLLSIVLNIYASFNQSPTLDVKANSLDISRAFDKVWHEELIFKLEHIGISGNLLSHLKRFLNNRFQRVVLNG